MRNARSVERPTSLSGRHAWRHGQQYSLGSGVPINKVVVAEEATDFHTLESSVSESLDC